MHLKHFAAISSIRLREALLLGCLTTCGCGDGVTPNPDPVGFDVKVTSGGKPVTGVNLGLQPTGPGLPTGVALLDGTGKGKAIAGTYVYFVAETPQAPGQKAAPGPSAALKSIPMKYHQPNMLHELTVSEGATIDLKLD